MYMKGKTAQKKPKLTIFFIHRNQKYQKSTYVTVSSTPMEKTIDSPYRNHHRNQGHRGTDSLNNRNQPEPQFK